MALDLNKIKNMKKESSQKDLDQKNETANYFIYSLKKTITSDSFENKLQTILEEEAKCNEDLYLKFTIPGTADDYRIFALGRFSVSTKTGVSYGSLWKCSFDNYIDSTKLLEVVNALYEIIIETLKDLNLKIVSNRPDFNIAGDTTTSYKIKLLIE